MKILIVDDSKYMRYLIHSIVTEAGYEVVGEASDGQNAIEIYDALLPDLVFMDITMPEMSGLDALKNIKKNHPTSNIIMCSALGQQRLVMECILAGASDFITKPFKAQNLIYILNRMSPEK